MQKKTKKKGGICKFCKKSYEEEAAVVNFHGEFCLHDDKLRIFRFAQGMGGSIRNDSVTGGPHGGGQNSAEQKYIDKNERAGDTVVRGSDGTLRTITTKKDMGMKIKGKQL